MLRMVAMRLASPALAAPHHHLPACRALSMCDSLFSARPAAELAGRGLRRGFRASHVVEMGRRAAKIAARKGKEDRARGKLYGRIGKQIVAAVKAGGPSENSNSQLASVLQMARLNNIPKDLIERNIKKASEKGVGDYMEVTYEAYGLGGAGIVVEVLTDNLNRSAGEVRQVITKAGAKMADPGSVLFNFARRGCVVLTGGTEDEVMAAALEAGADDVQPREDGSAGWEVLSEVAAFGAVQSALRDAGLPILSEECGLRLVPTVRVDVTSDEHYAKNEEIVEKLLDLDDVDAVYCNMNTDDTE